MTELEEPINNIEHKLKEVTRRYSVLKERKSAVAGRNAKTERHHCTKRRGIATAPPSNRYVEIGHTKLAS